ncbi:MAG TPA: hypothetical protein VLX92_33140 [Kofleriaceae bacterium]|nr:hypothetical protein [Kofleriaceae bacterium]
MKTSGWIVVVAVLGGAGVMAMRGCLSRPAPDEQLGKRFDAMCEIARANVDTPARGVRELGGYLGKHLDDVLGEWGATIATIEQIRDDDKHDARARLARKRIVEPLVRCERDWQRFDDAVGNDPEARALIQHFAERLDRTLQILIGKGHVDLRDLPRALENMVP